jgi:hypothetical protein
MKPVAGIDLPAANRSASAALSALVRDASVAVPELAPAGAGADRKQLGDSLVRFEALRASLPAPQRVDAAAWLVRAAAERLVYAGADGRETPLCDYMSARAAPLATQRTVLGTGGALVPSVEYGASRHAGQAIVALAQAMSNRHELTRTAADALSWAARQGAFDLSREKFVVMGAAAEIAPTEFLLHAGATVLFLDVYDAAGWAAERGVRNGTLVFAKGGADLVAQPREIAGTIAAFADGTPVHIGAFAYRGGRNMEWRLAAAMNAIIRALDPAIVRSIGMAVSPTSPAQASADDVAEANRRLARPSPGDRFWRGIGVQRASLLEHAGAAWPRTVVAMQGASYLAAQYFEKRLAAEVYGTRGVLPDARRPVRMSANVAPVTRTGSMDIPLFQAGFVGAEALGVRSYAPETTRAISGLVYLENLFNPSSVAAPPDPSVDENERARRIHATQIHGGLFAYPYATDGTMIRAGLIGLAKRPALIPGVVLSVLRGK